MFAATIPAMCYTHGSDCDVVARMDTLQVFSVKVASIEKGLRWPLQAYGMISARDVVDRKRNIIFARARSNCQTITEKVTIFLSTVSNQPFFLLLT
jgi:hypothetical protein